MKRLRVLAALLTAVMVATACGSTVRQAGQGHTSDPADAPGLVAGEPLDTGGATATDPLGSPTASSPRPSLPATGETTPADTSGPGTAPAAEPPAPTADGSPAASPSSTVAGPVEVGIIVHENTEAFTETFGAAFSLGDMRADAQAVVDHMNATGGLAGHEIVPIYYTVDDTTTQNYAVVEQAICTEFTEDHQVVAALGIANLLARVLPACMQQHQTPLFVLSGGNLSLDEAYDQWPALVTPAMASNDRGFGTMARRLGALGYLDEDAVYGIVRFDLPDAERVSEQVVQPALAAHGVQVTAEAALKMPENTADISSMAPQVQAAQLQFRSRGVDHVIMLDAFGLIGLVWLPAAEGSGWRPRYALTSNSGLAALAATTPTQLGGAVAIGWTPTYDVSVDQDDPLLETSESVACVELMTDANQDMSDRAAKVTALHYCDMFASLESVAHAAAVIDAPGLLQAIDAAGSRPSAVTFQQHLGPGHHDGPVLAGDMAFDTSCNCFRYTGGQIELQ